MLKRSQRNVHVRFRFVSFPLCVDRPYVRLYEHFTLIESKCQLRTFNQAIHIEW